jgi:hypothetical protein
VTKNLFLSEMRGLGLVSILDRADMMNEIRSIVEVECKIGRIVKAEVDAKL